MKKSDLKTGMIVETANRNRYLVLEDHIIREDGYNSLSDYDENLKCDSNPDYDIIKVFKSNYDTVYSTDSLFYDENLILLWKGKPESIELTLEDIAKKFNVDVNLIKIKK